MNETQTEDHNLETMCEAMRNAKSGFGFWLTGERDGGLDLFCETDEGERALMHWKNNHYYAFTVEFGDVLLGGGDFSATQMLTYGESMGLFPVDGDDIGNFDLEEDDDPESFFERLDAYEEDTLRILGLTA